MNDEVLNMDDEKVIITIRIDDDMTVNLALPKIIDASEIHGHFLKISQLSKSVIQSSPNHITRPMNRLTQEQLNIIKTFHEENPEMGNKQQSKILSGKIGANYQTIYSRIMDKNFTLNSSVNPISRFTPDEDKLLKENYNKDINGSQNATRMNEYFKNRTRKALYNRIEYLKGKGDL